jgi:FSR family fosmidomycin resistance protein-like MFS transporter
VPGRSAGLRRAGHPPCLADGSHLWYTADLGGADPPWQRQHGKQADAMTTEAVAEARSADTKRFQTDRVTTIAAGHAVHDTYTAFLAPLLPVFIETMSLTNTRAGLLSVFVQAPSLAQPFLAPAITGLAMSLLGVAPTYGVLVLLLLLAGTTSAGLHAVGPVMAGRLSGNSLGRGMGFWMVGGELGRTLGPIIIVSAVQILTLQGTPWLMVGGLLASVLLYVRLKDLSGRPATAGQGLPWRQALHAMGPFLPPLAAIIMVRAFMIAALTTYLPIFLSEEGANLWFAGASLAVLEAAGVVGALLGGSLSDRWGRRLVLAISLLVTPILMVIFLAAGGWARFPLLLLLGFTALSTIPVIMAMVQESFPENRALANGVYMSLAFVLRSIAIVLLGIMGDTWGMRTAFAISAALPLLGLPFLRLLPSRRR